MSLVDIVNARFPLKPLETGEYTDFKAKPLTVHLDWYYAQGLGNVSFLKGKAMGGLMRMDTVVVNATDRDMPLLSYDYISAMGNFTVLVEYYDTLLEKTGFDAVPFAALKDKLAALPDHDLGCHWYDYMKLAPSFAKKVKKAALPGLGSAVTDAFEAYAAAAAALPELDAEQIKLKRAKSAEYVNGLLKNGGPSTDAFKKAIGPERTRELFTKIVFGSEV